MAKLTSLVFLVSAAVWLSETVFVLGFSSILTPKTTGRPLTPLFYRCERSMSPRGRSQFREKQVYPLFSSPDESLTPDESSVPADEASEAIEEGGQEKKSLVQKIRAYFTPPDDGLSFRQRLAKMGLAVALSYGWVSNMSYTVTVSLAWFIFSKNTGKSPLAPGQWKGFLAVYGGFWVFNNIIRPIRLTVSVAVSPQFERIVQKIQDRLGVSKSTAIFITVFMANVVGTTTLMCAGILLAATIAGVPVFPPKV